MTSRTRNELRSPGKRPAVARTLSKTDLAGTGVEPDVKIAAEDALTTAEKLGQKRSRRTVTNSAKAWPCVLSGVSHRITSRLRCQHEVA